MTGQEYVRLFKLYGNDIYRFVLSSCRNVSDAEDITQNVFIKLFNREEPFGDDIYAKRWLFTVAANECRNIFSSFWRSRVSYMDDNCLKEKAFSIKEHSELYDAVRNLPQKYRTLVHLYYYEGYSVKEISEILNIKESTVQTRLMRARERLKTALER